MKASASIAASLETWFAKAKRDMPWRRKATAYRCWLSEIMMQQTTYASVLPYYTRFLERFPSVESLASAEEADVLKAWEGLGYYARAHNLHRAAKAIAAGRWPETAAEWAKVPGVGPYTAAALASVLNGERAPVVDGNVARVFARLWALGDDFRKQPARARLAARLRPEIERAHVPGDFNQAMMELGALVCTPTSPDCGACPLAAQCAARKGGAQGDYPVKTMRKPLPVRTRTVVIVYDGAGRVLLVQNREGGLLRGLWDLPTLEEVGAQSQVFSHFRLEQKALAAVGAAAEFKDPETVPLTTAARRALSAHRLRAS